MALCAELAKINPLFDNDKAVPQSRDQCTSILGGSLDDKLTTSAKTRFTAGQPGMTGKIILQQAA